MYGLIGSLHTTADGRQHVIDALIGSSAGMTGNIHYLVAEDADDDTAVWITEVWESEAAHAASLQLPAVRDAIELARPYITGIGQRIVTVPVARASGAPSPTA